MTLAWWSIVVAIVTAACAASSPTCPDTRVIEVVTARDAGTDGASAADDAGIIDNEEPLDIAGGYTSPSCASACANLRRLHCPEGATRPGEDSCYVVCRRAESTRGRIDFKPRCVAAARDRTALAACETYRCR